MNSIEADLYGATVAAPLEHRCTYRMPEPRTRIRLCGPLALEIDGRDTAAGVPAGQARSLLGFLLARGGGPVDRAELIDVLWPEQPPRDPQAALRPILSRLRRAVAPAEIEGRERVRLVLPAPVWMDVEAAARAAPEEALELIGAGFLPEIEAEWVRARRDEVEELRLTALERVGDEAAARELVARAPYRESGYRLLMQALADAGNVAEALRVYDQLRVLLRDELGITPAPALVALHARLLGGEGAVPVPAILAARQGAFIGRASELDTLREAWRAGRRRFVLVSGPPGIGKTRLTAELAQGVDGTVLYGSCPPEPLLSYQPFVEALGHYARNATPTLTGPGAVELAHLIPELAVDPGTGPVSEDPETRRYLMFEAIAALLRTATPALLVLDDLHWADRPTLQLLRHVLRAQDAAPLLVVGTCREGEAPPELADLLADLRRDRLLTTVALAGLDEDDVAAVIAAHAGQQAPSALVHTVHAETDGNPFFVEEVVRHLLETDRFSEAPGPIGVPEGVKEVLLSRLDRLSEPCRTTLLNAAVLGREFDFPTLQRMADANDDTVIAALEEALGARLAVDTDGGYAFTHALVRETLYGTLSAPRRQRLHARAAAALEPSAATLSALARHHRLAGPAGDAGKAIEFSLQAGARASSAFAWEEAASHFEGALAVMDRAAAEPAARARLLVALADLMAVIGDLGRQITCLERALALHRELGDDERAAQAHSRLGQAHSLIDSIYGDHLDIRRAFEHFDAARPVLERGPARKARGHLELGVSTALTYGLQIPRGIEAAQRAIEIAERLGDEALWAGATEAYGWHKIIAGDLQEGFDAEERAFVAADRGQRPFLAWMATNIRGQMAWGIGDPDNGRRFFERAGALPYAQNTARRAETADGIGRCHAARGELDAARRLLSDARPAWVSHSLEPLIGLWSGDWDRVAALAGRVSDTSRRNGNRWDEWASDHLAARVAHLRGDHARAAEQLERALAIVADGGADYFALWVLPDLARVRAEVGRVTEARAAVERCRAILGRGEDWRGRAGVIAMADAVVLSAEDRLDAANERFAAAEATLARYGLVGERAECLYEWGRALADAEKLAAARALYLNAGAGAAWLERVEGDARNVLHCDAHG
jgi:DNA-binding SARP family transcriptional activator/tetratricopeptide (TPR) repeat protein